jgi:hypothetical protein
VLPFDSLETWLQCVVLRIVDTIQDKIWGELPDAIFPREVPKVDRVRRHASKILSSRISSLAGSGFSGCTIDSEV